ncbi:MAG: hypothetical protein WCJ26_13655 [bacterium]
MSEELEDFRSDLKASQGASDAIKLPTERTFVSKTNKELVKPGFRYYDPTAKENAWRYDPLKGILIGSAMRVSSFDSGYGKGVRSNLYFSHKNNISLYWSGDNKSFYRGDWEGAKKATQNPKQVMCLFLLTSGGLIEIQTNLSIAIDQLKRIKDKSFEYLITLTPTVYSKESNISKATKDILGPLCFTNPPTFADISLGDPLTNEIAAKYEAKKHARQFVKFKEYRNGLAPEPQSTEIIEEGVIEPEMSMHSQEREIVEKHPFDDEPTIATAPVESAKDRALRKQAEKDVSEENIDFSDLPF